MTSSTWLTAAEVEALFGFRQPRLYQLAREEVLPAGVVLRLGRAVRFHRPRLEAWLDAGGSAFPGGGWRRAIARPSHESEGCREHRI